jgi:predicted amidohydrolase
MVEDIMRIATAAYPITWLNSWDEFEQKLDHWVADAADHGAEFLVFPEYASMELSSLAGEERAAKMETALSSVSDVFDRICETYKNLAKRYGVHILSGSAPVWDDGRYVNRLGVFDPSGAYILQDKQIMTRFEREEWCVEHGNPLNVIETDLGRFGILICYDSEFPKLGRALKDVDVLLVPSCTEAMHGYWRVRIGAMARALENQCVSVMSSLLSNEARFNGVDEATGTGGVFGPPDRGFPADGVMALGEIGTPGWTYCDINLDAIKAVRKDGVVLNRTHWSEQDMRDLSVPVATVSNESS